jgi:hypothetical protein
MVVEDVVNGAAFCHQSRDQQRGKAARHTLGRFDKPSLLIAKQQQQSKQSGSAEA